MNNKSKLLHHIAAKYISDQPVNISFEGKEVELIALKNLLESSRNLKLELESKDTNLDKVMSLIEEKKENARKFEQLTNIDWYL